MIIPSNNMIEYQFGCWKEVGERVYREYRAYGDTNPVFFYGTTFHK